MNKTTKCCRSFCIAKLALVFICVWLSGPGALNAQPVTSVTEAGKLAREAEQMANRGQADQALRMINAAINSSPRATDKVKLRLLFTSAWLQQQMADGSKDRRKAWLERAASTYRQILAIPTYGEHQQTRENLAIVLQQLGNTDEAIKLLTPDTKDNPRQRYQYALRAGDILTESRQFSEALQQYLKAQKEQPNDSVAPWRIVRIFPRLPDMQLLYKISEEWVSGGHTQVGLRGFESLFKRKTEDVEPVQRRALVRWVELEATQLTLTFEKLDSLRSRGKPFQREIQELIAFAQGRLPAEGADLRRYFWSGDNLKRHILATALRSLAKDYERKKLFEDVERTLTTGIDLISPNPGDYARGNELKNKSIVRLDLALDLATLYRIRPSLDRAGTKFKRLENNLLNEKNEAYHNSQLGAIQKFHTVLGLIYADRGAWEDSGWKAAPYHLKRAVRTAQNIADRDPDEFQPLPHLTYMLASGMEKQVGNSDEVNRLYVNAAKGYLDVNDLSQAGTALTRAKPTGGTQAKQEVDLLNQVLAVRNKVHHVNIKEIPENERQQWIEKEVDFLQPEQGAINPVFLHRQRAKLWTDYGTKIEASNKDKPSAGIKYFQNSFQELKKGGVVTVGDLKTLVNPRILDSENLLGRPISAVPDNELFNKTVPKTKLDTFKIDDKSRLRKKQ